MSLLTKDNLFAYQSPAPLTEFFTIPELGGEVEITGIRTKAELTALKESAKALDSNDKGELFVVIPGGVNYTASADDVNHAVWVAACVKAPVLNAYEWLVAESKIPGVLEILWIRSLVCSRQISDISKAKEDLENTV